MMDVQDGPGSHHQSVQFTPVPICDSTPPAHDGVTQHRGLHSVPQSPEKGPTDPKGSQSPQKVEASPCRSL